jgi:hypothetical protein
MAYLVLWIERFHDPEFEALVLGVRIQESATQVVVYCLTLLLRIHEIPGSNIYPETHYANWGFSWLSSFPPGKFWARTLKLKPLSILSSSFPDHHSFIYRPFIRHYIVQVTVKVSLNKLQKKQFPLAPLSQPADSTQLLTTSGSGLRILYNRLNCTIKVPAALTVTMNR